MSVTGGVLEAGVTAPEPARPAGGELPRGGDVVVLPQVGAIPDVPDDDLVVALIEAEAVGRRVDALRVALAGEVAERSRRELGSESLAARRGCRTGAELVQRATGVARATALRRIRLGAAVRPGTSLTGEVLPPRFSAVAEGLARGALGVDAACAVVDTLTPSERVAGREAVRVAEAEIVADLTGGAVDGDSDASVGRSGGAGDRESWCLGERDAGDLADQPPRWDADDVRLQAALWRAVLDPDGAAPSVPDAERRGLVLGRARRGLVPISGLLLPDVAAGLRRYADAFTNPRTPDAPAPKGFTGTQHDPERAEHDAGVAGEDAELTELGRLADRRSRAHILHDVLANAIAVAARATETSSMAGAAPTLVVTVEAASLASGKGVAWADGEPVDLAVARQTACAGAVERVLTGRGGRVVGLQTLGRCFTGQQRRAIAARDGAECLVPGCHVLATWCEVHHVTPFVDDPTGTRIDNGVLLCWYHHRSLHQSGWEIRIVDGLPQVRAPGWLDRTRTWRDPRPAGRAPRPPGRLPRPPVRSGAGDGASARAPWAGGRNETNPALG